MRTPRRGVEQLHFLAHHQRAEPDGEAVHERGIGEDRGPVGTPRRIVGELPEMDELVDRAGIGLEVADEISSVAAFLKRRIAELLIELYRTAILPT